MTANPSVQNVIFRQPVRQKRLNETRQTIVHTLKKKVTTSRTLVHLYLHRSTKKKISPSPPSLFPFSHSSSPPFLPSSSARHGGVNTNKKPKIMKRLGVLLILISSSCSLLKVLAVMVWEDACTDNEIHPPIPEIYQCMYQAFFFSRESLASQRDHFSYPRGLRYSEWG